MSIDKVNDISPRVQYAAAAGQTAFDYPFPIFASTDLVVVVGTVTKALGTDYTVTGAGNNTGGTVTRTVGSTAGDVVTIYRDIPIARITDFQQNGPWTSAAINDELDRMTLIDQQLNAADKRALRISNIDTASVAELPPAAVRANLALVFDAQGNPTVGNLTSAAFNASQSFTATAGQTVFTLSVAAAVSNIVIVSLDGAVLVPGVDYAVNGNRITLISGALAGQTLYVTASVALSQLNPTTTAAEIAAGVIPANLQYPADPYVDPRRYGADPTGVIDSTAALQTAINVAYQAGSAVFIGGKFLTGALSLTMTGTATKPLRIYGSAAIGSALIAKPGLAATSLLTFTTANPNTTLIEAFLVIENIQILSPAITVGVQGLSLFGIAKWTLRNVRIARFDVGLDIQNTENHTADSCEFVANRTGVRVALLGAFFNGMPTPTLQRFNNCVMNLNTFRGVDYNSGTGLYLIECGIEGNGTAADVTTGGVFIGNACSPDLQEGHVVIQNCWLENNKGWTINQAAQVNGNLQRIAIKGCEIIGAESGRAVLISGGWIAILEDLQSSGVGDTFNITCQYGYLNQLTVSTLVGSGIVFPFYSNVQESTRFHYLGRVDTWTATLTGCATSPTAGVTTIQQGDEVTFILPELTAVSNTTACSLTGIPAKYQPTAGVHFIPAIVENNSIDTPQQALLQVANSAIILFQGGSQTGFTASGSKGTRRGDIKFRLAA